MENQISQPYMGPSTMNEQSQRQSLRPAGNPGHASVQPSPDSLMGDFHSKPLLKIILVTVIVHLLIVGGFSFGYFKRQLLGQSTASMTDAQKLDLAVRDGTTALREIAERYGVNVQDLSGRFSGSAAPRPAPAMQPDAQPATQPGSDAPVNNDQSTPPQQPKSEIEKVIEQKEPGPEVPDLSIEKEGDLFAPTKP